VRSDFFLLRGFVTLATVLVGWEWEIETNSLGNGVFWVSIIM